VLVGLWRPGNYIGGGGNVKCAAAIERSFTSNPTPKYPPKGTKGIQADTHTWLMAPLCTMTKR
jgi:hypothetical protein